MKKLLTVVAAACIACGASAASVKWQMKPGADYAGWTGYIVSGTTSDALASTLATVLATDAAPKTWVDAVAPIAASGTIGNRGTLNGTVAEAGEASTYTLVVFDGDIATGSKYAVFDTFNVSDYAYSGAQTPTTMTVSGLKGSGTLASETGGGDDPGTGGGDDPGTGGGDDPGTGGGDDPGTGGGDDPGTGGGGGESGGTVPEPTSGILLMLGGAALALRRRR